MNRKCPPKVAASLSLWLAAAVQLPGQQSAEPAGSEPSTPEETVILSPFTVESKDEEGYAAQYTLAGTRLRTDIKDVGSSISVVTSKFLQDTATTNATELLVYTPNTEVAGQGGNFLNVGDEEYAGRVRYGTNRVRGLSNADNTRDFFLTDIPWDSYNTGRIDIQRGPNSILFGIGSPAGIINASINKAAWVDSTSLQNKIDNFGTVRFSADINRVLIDKQLAVRISLLDDNTEYRQRPAFRDDRRIYAALRYDPAVLNRGSVQTSFEATFERGDIEQNLPRQAAPTDYLTPFFDLSASRQSQGVRWRDGTGADAFPDGAFFGNASDLLTQGGSVIAFDQNSPTSTSFPENAGETQWAGVGFYRGITSSSTAINFKNKGRIPGAAINAFKAIGILDRSIFDSYNNLLDGDTKRENLDFEAFSAAFRQSFFENTFGYEVAVDLQRTRPENYHYLGTQGYGIGIDVQGTLAGGILGGSPNPAGGVYTEVPEPVNPNLGKAYVVGARGSGWDWARNEKLSARATAYYELDLKKKSESRLADIFGKNVFTGLISRYQDKSFSGSGSMYVIGDNNPAEVLEEANLYFLNYLSQRVFSGSNASGINLPVLAGLPDLAPATRLAWNTTTKSWYPVTFNVTDNFHVPVESRTYGSGVGKSRRTVDTAAVVWQGYWFDGNVVPLVAFRRDSSWFNQGGVYNGSDFEPGAPNQEINDRTYYYPFDSNYVLGPSGPKSSVNSKTFSLVTHTPHSWRDKLPGNIDVQLIFNRSENFQPSPGRTDIMNRPLPDPSGETKEYGVAISALDNKLYLKVAHYETKQNDVRLGDFFGGNIGSIAAQEVWARSGAYVHSGLRGGVGPTAGGDGSWQADKIYGYSSDGNAVTFKPYGPWAVNNEVIGGQPGSDNAAGGAVTTWDGRSNGYDIWNGSNEPYAAGTVRLNYTQAEIDATWAIQKAAIDAVRNNPPPDEFIAANGINRTAFFGADGPGMFDYGGGTATAEVTGSTISKGTEFELIANPIDGLSVLFNATYTRAKRTGIAESFLDYINSRRPFFYGPAGDMRIWGSGEADNAEDPYTSNYNASMKVAFRNQVDSQISLYLAATDTYVPELHPWAFNTIANYAFQQGAFRGFNVGGGIRWQDKLVNGYPVTVDEFGNETYDLDNPYYGKTQLSFDTWIGYERKLTEKINWRVQLNIRNLTANDRWIRATVNPDGSGAAYRIPEPRTFTLTNTLEF